MPRPLLPMDAPVVDAQTRQATGAYRTFFQFLDRLIRGAPEKCTVTYGTGSPAGAVLAPVGSLFIRTDGGASTVLYIKESGGSTSAGWRAV